jgi:hypothetical protein
MLRIKTINGSLYVVSIEGGKLVVYSDRRQIHSRVLYPHDSEENLFREGWEIAEHHAHSPGENGQAHF